MRSTMTIVGARTFSLDLGLLVQFTSATLIPFSSTGLEYFTIGTTPSGVFVPLYTYTCNVDTNGKIVVVMIHLKMYSNNDANGESKLQISGDGGATFVDVTNTIPAGAQTREGAGLWITEIQPGTDILKKLQFQVMGRSTNGLPAAIKVRADSIIEFVLNKKIV